MNILKDKNIINKSNKGGKMDRLEDYLIANEIFLPERTIIPNTSLTFLINGYDRSLIEITFPPISTLIVG